MMSQTELAMTFDPLTIDHLGVRMYSTLPPVLAELISNAYDADAENVILILRDAADKEVVIEDDGVGMSFDEINSKFLRIGRPRREDDGIQETRKRRKIIGKKGLGKLSFFGIAHEIEISTRKDGKENVFLMNWDDIKNEKEKYKPKILKYNIECPSDSNGTKIVLRKIKRESDFSAEDIANSLSRMFLIVADFKITIRHNDETPIVVKNEMRFAGLEKEVEWKIPVDSEYTDDYENRGQISGYLIATKKPIPPKSNMRGVILFSRKKLVNMPEYFSDSTSSHFFSYLTGWLEVDFIDDLEEDVIATNRQSLNWGHEAMQKLRGHLRGLVNWLERDWRKKREEKRGKDITQATGIDIPQWFSKLPEDVREKMEPVIKALIKDSELPVETNREAVVMMHEIVPEYPRYHWRNLHPEVQKITKDDYINQRYFDAAEKAARLYLSKVKEKSGVDSGRDSNDVDSAFNLGNGILLVTACNDPTEQNIQNGQHLLSKGIVAGCRNPLTHNPEYQKKLVDTGLFTEKDCLDMLSMISHLFARLDKAQKRT